jgi:rfaE bifunctional protein kinase chain/domain
VERSKIEPISRTEILAGFPRLRALVVGDVCLDRWSRYDPKQSEPSRETGIPRVGVVLTDCTPGAAGTVAANLGALGCGHVAVLGVAGEDGFAWELDCALRARRIDTTWLLRSSAVSTFTYTKLLNIETGIEDRPRVDFINMQPLPDEMDEKLVSTLHQIAGDFDVILVSDQAETGGGVVTSRMRDALSGLGKLVWVDSRKRCELFRNVILKPNREEADAASLRACGRVDYAALRQHTRAKLLVITYGPEGAQVVDDSGETWVPTRANQNPVDICGAGDSFSAGAALALAVTGSAVEAARFGNLVASVTIMKKGTGTASPDELI